MDNKAQTLSALLSNTFKKTNDFFTSDMSLADALQLSQTKSLVSKYVERDSKVDSATPALQLFDEMNLRCRSSFVLPDGSDYFEDDLLGMQRIAYRCLTRWDGPVFKLADACCEGLPGPGVSAGVRGTDFLSKVSEGKLTYPDPRLYAYYRAYVSPRWTAFEEARERMHGCAAYAKSEVFTVPKKTEIDRVALKEPSLGMFFQKGVGTCIEKVLKRSFGIQLETQPDINRAMAKRGSLTGRFATIDLKSASDTIAYNFVKWLLPPEIFSVLDTCRSKESDRGELYMFSSMGNGFTFPLQTFIFSVLVTAAYQSLGIPVKGVEDGLPTWSVFGDDIIVVREAYNVVTSLLARCGFIVNVDKSFNNGPFRESCGRDYFRGHDVRGVYLKRLETDAHFYSAFNRLHRWSIRHGINCNELLQHLFGQAKFLPVPFDAGDTAGHHWPRSLLAHRKQDRNGAEYYRANRPVARKRGVERGHSDALLVAAVGGYLSSDRVGRRIEIGLRSSNPRWKVVRECTPSWDYIPYAGLTIRDYTYSCLVSFCS